MGSQFVWKMCAKPSVSQQFRHLDAQFNEDADTLATSIRNLKAQAACPAAELEVDVTPVIQPPETNLASRAKDLRGMTERRFAEVIDGWRRQNDALQQELDMYQNQQRISPERVQKRNTEIKNLRNENEKLTSLLRKCEERINQLFDVKERKEKKRANKLADQLFDHKKMIGDLQEQLKEAEKLLATTKHERNDLLVENHALKKGNQELRRDLIAAERDTQETKIELEMIESMVQSMDNISSGNGCRVEQGPIKLREAPSAMTALNILQENHKSGIADIQKQISSLKHKEASDRHEIDKLQAALNHLTD